MMEEQRLVTPTDMGRDINEHRSKRRIILTRFLRNILIGVGIAIVLTCIESCVSGFSIRCIYSEVVVLILFLPCYPILLILHCSGFYYSYK